MLQIQGEFFARSKPNFTKIGAGAFSTVFASPCNGWVYKQSHSNDGALAWLAFCQTQQGRRGVPVIKSLILSPYHGFACLMKRYAGCQIGKKRGQSRRGEVLRASEIEQYRAPPRDYPEFAYLADFYAQRKLRAAVIRAKTPEFTYLFDLLDDFYKFSGIVADDLHDGNIMWCTDTESYILTDPNGECVARDDVRHWLHSWEPSEFTLQ
jgi:hypothetical protein